MTSVIPGYHTAKIAQLTELIRCEAASSRPNTRLIGIFADHIDRELESINAGCKKPATPTIEDLQTTRAEVVG